MKAKETAIISIEDTYVLCMYFVSSISVLCMSFANILINCTLFQWLNTCNVPCSTLLFRSCFMNEKGHYQIFLNSKRKKNLFRFGMEVLCHNMMRIFHLMYHKINLTPNWQMEIYNLHTLVCFCRRILPPSSLGIWSTYTTSLVVDMLTNGILRKCKYLHSIYRFFILFISKTV